MTRAGLLAANLALHIAHIALILLVFAGWWFCETRLWSVLLIAATFVSWYGLKPFFAKDSAYGYCIITDVQWRLRKRLGLPAPEDGYMKYLIDFCIPGSFADDVIQTVTLYIFLGCILGAAVTAVVFGWC